MKSLIKITLLFALIFTAANFSTAVAQSVDIKTFNIIGTDNMKFDMVKIEAIAGEEIRIVYTSKSNFPKTAMAHNVVVMTKDTDVQAFANASARARDNEYIAPGFEDSIVAATALAGGGETVEVTFVVPSEPGDYVYICSFPGHYGAGMKGVITVTAPKS
ncbi:MAG: plastocyanin/azurin family copper-binding protein [Balneolaceae bacterium]